MKLCKHDYCLIINEKTPNRKDWKYTDKGILVEIQSKVDCMVICKKCGKEKKRLSKKIGKYYANTVNYNYTESIKKQIEK